MSTFDNLLSDIKVVYRQHRAPTNDELTQVSFFSGKIFYDTYYDSYETKKLFNINCWLILRSYDDEKRFEWILKVFSDSYDTWKEIHGKDQIIKILELYFGPGSVKSLPSPLFPVRFVRFRVFRQELSDSSWIDFCGTISSMHIYSVVSTKNFCSNKLEKFPIKIKPMMSLFNSELYTQLFKESPEEMVKYLFAENSLEFDFCNQFLKLREEKIRWDDFIQNLIDSENEEEDEEEETL